MRMSVLSKHTVDKCARRCARSVVGVRISKWVFTLLHIWWQCIHFPFSRTATAYGCWNWHRSNRMQRAMRSSFAKNYIFLEYKIVQSEYERNRFRPKFMWRNYYFSTINSISSTDVESMAALSIVHEADDWNHPFIRSMACAHTVHTFRHRRVRIAWICDCVRRPHATRTIAPRTCPIYFPRACYSIIFPRAWHTLDPASSHHNILRATFGGCVSMLSSSVQQNQEKRIFFFSVSILISYLIECKLNKATVNTQFVRIITTIKTKSI